MTLSNIFYGKKVVQKAYLNNALIYQSNGWETLPSTCTEVWTKNYERVGSFGSIAKDSEDNIYIGASNTLYKIGPDGDLKWKTNVKVTIDNVRQVTGIVVLSNCIYCSFYEIQSSVVGYISKFDINGNLISSTAISSFLTVTANNYFTDMKNDNNNIYAITTDRIFKLDFDLKLIDYTSVPDTASCIATNNGSYVFVGTAKYGIKFNKDNLKNSINLVGVVNINFPTTSIALDSIGHAYLTSSSNSNVFIFDEKSSKYIRAFSMGSSDCRIYSVAVDNWDNLYMVYYSGINYLLRKYSSDGTLIWDNIRIPTTYDFLKVITDSNNNIYVAYIDNNGMLAIKKLINLVKET